jgi:hypothetical protein
LSVRCMFEIVRLSVRARLQSSYPIIFLANRVRSQTHFVLSVTNCE